MNSVNSLRLSQTLATFRVGLAIGVCVLGGGFPY